MRRWTFGGCVAGPATESSDVTVLGAEESVAKPRRRPRRRSRKRKRKPAWPVWARTAGEAAALLTAALIGGVGGLGRGAGWGAGCGWAPLVPFAGGGLGVGI